MCEFLLLSGSNKTMHIFSVGLCLFCWIVFTQAGTPLFLTPYIKHDNATMGRHLSMVDPKQFLNITSYSGYITVDESHDSNLFFWYFPSSKQDDISNTPLIIWLQGGPGGTSLFGTFMEIGPFYLKQYNETYTKLQLRSTSWGKDHSLLFIDNPVGAGFSFTRDMDGYVTNLDTCAEQLYSFLQQFLTVFPELRSAPLFIAGESYAGRFVPVLAKKVHESKESKENRKINLQGLIMGNPFLSRTDAPNITQIFYQWGLIDQQGVLAAKELQDSYVTTLQNKDTSEAYDLWNRLLDKLQELSLEPQLYNVLQYQTLDTRILIEYLNSEKFKENMHVRNNTISLVDHNIHTKLMPDFLRNMDSTMNLLLEHYRVLIYCGQLDLIEPCVPNAEARRKNWRWSGRSQFLKAHRKPLLAPTISGYFKSGGRLTEVLISGAGHLVPIDKPEVAQLMVSYFARGEELPTDPNITFKDDLPDLDEIQISDNTNQQQPVQIVNSTNVMNTISWVLNGIFITVILVAAVMYVRHRRRTHDYLIDDEDSLNNAVLSMS